RDQMTRAAISILSNISEGFERSGNKEFVQFLFISKGSAGELLSQVIIATDQKIITEQESNVLIEDLKLIGAQIGSLINYLKNSELKGSKFKK
ncbi:MAG: four helix bundle protein, partial [Bacteroidia bacterium]|nr:four helix bundle protein [Bacteroidia bacterium]